MRQHPALWTTLLSITAVLPCLALADNDDSRLEEIIVTAQKRSENLQKVPLSVSAVTAAKLEKANIDTIEDLTSYVPSVHFTETGFSTQVRIRGIGSDNSQGFEQSVGMYIDDIYYGRAQLFRTPMMDMERAEILRGPQTTLFGKNSIAGALNLTTARPTEDFAAKVSISQEIEQNQQEINGVISGPITDTINARLAHRSYSEDGYFYNSYKNRTEPRSEEQSTRLSLTWQANDTLDIFVKGEHNSFDTVGRPIEITQDIPLVGDTNYAQHLTQLGQPTIESDQPYVRQYDSDETSDNQVNNITLNADYQWGEHTLSLVSGWLEFDYVENCDCDNTASEIVVLDLGEDYRQFSQEIRLSSPIGNSIDWIAGVYYQTWKQNFYDQLNVSDTNLLNVLIAPSIADTGVRRDFSQDSTTWSAFARMTWHPSEQWHITLGARVTQESKESHKELNIVRPSSGNILDSPAIGGLYFAAFQVESEQFLGAGPVAGGHKLSVKREDTPIMPLLNIEYDLNDDVMMYASLSKGFKAGGADPRSNTKRFFEFEDESAQALELGTKATVFNGRGEVNLSLFHTNYTNLQISQFDGKVGFNPGNAGEAEIQGFEFDSRWALFDKLQASVGVAYLDFTYTDFEYGNCPANQVPNGADTDGDNIADLCSFTGMRGVYTPEWTTNAALDFHTAITSDLDFTALLDMQWVDEQQVHVNLDETGMIDAYTIVNLRLAIEAEMWSVALLGKNLLDEYIVSYSANVPLSASSFATNSHFSVVRRPKSLAMEATLRF